MMKKSVIAVILSLVMSITMTSGCGNKAEDPGSDPIPATEAPAGQSEETDGAAENDDFEDGLKQIEAIGDVDVDKGLFDVTLTIPKDFIGDDMTQEKLDESAREKGYKSATLNSDGSVTYVMTKAQHKEMVDGIKDSINETLAEMVESEEYPNITDVTANDDFTSFTITTKNTEPDFSESFAVVGLYMCGGMYATFNGVKVDNIHVDYVNADSGEIISSANSKDMADD
ncbi:MAG: hypothetical protein K6G57_06800 [Lachnospiraceae bacterium]|nr:hypothetical protein [Lachnospiraceae bacterium]